jgi:hypothetical protein
MNLVPHRDLQSSPVRCPGVLCRLGTSAASRYAIGFGATSAWYRYRERFVANVIVKHHNVLLCRRRFILLRLLVSKRSKWRSKSTPDGGGMWGRVYTKHNAWSSYAFFAGTRAAPRLTMHRVHHGVLRSRLEMRAPKGVCSLLAAAAIGRWKTDWKAQVQLGVSRLL